LSASLLIDDDSSFDDTVTPDAPLLKYGRNGVPELRHVSAAIRRRCLSLVYDASRSFSYLRTNAFCTGRAKKEVKAPWMCVSVVVLCVLFASGSLTAFNSQLLHLNNILLGQETETFRLLPSAGLAVVSFSLVFADRTLDLVVKSVRERLWWCAHIQYLVKGLRSPAANGISKSLSAQLQV
jgi:hypothetical protein